MKADDARREIAGIVAAALASGLAVESNPPVSRRTAKVTYILWAAAIGMPSTPFGTVADYRWLLENRQYNLLLFDGSLLQAALVFQRDELISQNFCYYPCPVDLVPEDYSNDSSISDAIDKALLDALERLEWLDPLRESDTHLGAESGPQYSLRMRGPLRFDFDPNAQGPLHPASHLHLGDPECRIPVYAPISFGNFVRFVFRNYYRDHWRGHDFLRALPASTTPRCISNEDQRELFFECHP